jgi:hypothetical protein
VGGHYKQLFKEHYPDWEALHDAPNELADCYTCPQAYRTPIPEDGYSSSYIRDRAKEYLASQKSIDQLFCTFVSFSGPYHPFNPPGKYWDMDELSVSTVHGGHFQSYGRERHKQIIRQ